MDYIVIVPCALQGAIKGNTEQQTVYCFIFQVGIVPWHVHIYAPAMDRDAALAYRTTALKQAWEHMNLQLAEHNVQIAPYDEGDITYVS